MTEEDAINAVTAKLTGPPKLGSWVRIMGEAFRNYEGEVVELHRRKDGPRYGVKLSEVDTYDTGIILYFDFELMVLR